ncbi:MAG: CoA-disulfide reductase [Selenomonadales bacterium]|nr:CoA-disulfide reductase [Selenomonadales bacterium]
MKIVIVGGVAGGASCAARLRRIDEEATIVLFERGQHISFANCGLPYYIGNVIREQGNLLVQTPEGMSTRFAIDVRTESEVTAIDRAAKTVTVKNHATGDIYTESYDKLVLSPGASPIRPANLDAPNIFTLRNIPDTLAITSYADRIEAKRAVVVGGGFIGIEMAENLTERGIQVTLLELAPQIMPPLDVEMASYLHKQLRSHGVDLRLSTGLASVSDDGKVVTLTDGTTVETDLTVLGIGVRPETYLAQDAGLALGTTGGIRVNEQLQTSDPDIYAVGDAIEVTDYITRRPALIPLAGPANKQGRIAANNIAGRPEVYKGTQGSSVLKVFDMTAASTGASEKSLKRAGIAYERSYTHSLSHAGYYGGATLISLKLIYAPHTGKLLGAQAIGKSGVEKRIDVLATAIRAGMSVFDLEELELTYAPPYSSAKDPVNMGGYVASNLIKGDCAAIHWDEIGTDDSGYLVDVRTPYEYNRGTIGDAVNIPVDELRDRLAELPTDKPIHIICQVGLRGYIAYRILAAHGFTGMKNLSGGYYLYNTVMNRK